MKKLVLPLYVLMSFLLTQAAVETALQAEPENMPAQSSETKTSVKKRHVRRKKKHKKAKTDRSKGKITHKHFNLSKIHDVHTMGNVTQPKTETIRLVEPARGYKNAQYIQLATSEGPAQILFRSQKLTAERALRKRLHKSSRAAQKSVEIYAGNNAGRKGLTKIGEFVLPFGEKGHENNLNVEVNPNGQVHISGGESNTSIADFNLNP